MRDCTRPLIAAISLASLVAAGCLGDSSGPSGEQGDGSINGPDLVDGAGDAPGAPDGDAAAGPDGSPADGVTDGSADGGGGPDGEVSPEPECGDGTCAPSENVLTCRPDCDAPPGLSCLAQRCPEPYDSCLASDTCRGVVECLIECDGDEACEVGCLDEAEGEASAALASCNGQGGDYCVGGPAEDPASCQGRCGEYDEDAPCQCDGDCAVLGDCCDDFHEVCGGVCGDGACGPNESEEGCPEDCEGPTGPTCGDGTCEGSENADNCAADCEPAGPECGDGICQPSEGPNGCPEDCEPTGPVCGDGVCDADESADTCPEDCAEPPTGCGDGVCASDESAETCPEDCAEPPTGCGDGVCDADESADTCPEDCGVAGCIQQACGPELQACLDDAGCSETLECVQDCEGSGCGQQCLAGTPESSLELFTQLRECALQQCGEGGVCGDGTCAPGESAASCPVDCGEPGPECGDGVCEGGESPQSCPADCGEPGPECGDGDCDEEESAESCPADCEPSPVACIEQSCPQAVGACIEDPACSEVLSCFADCGGGDTPCAEGCLDGATDSAALVELTTCAEQAGCLDGSASYCGDGVCDDDETPESCTTDCEAPVPECGNEVCEPGESAASCPEDCDETNPACGDGICAEGETPESCPEDCPVPPECGDGVCDEGETAASCPADCGDGEGLLCFEIGDCLREECPEGSGPDCGQEALQGPCAPASEKEFELYTGWRDCLAEQCGEAEGTEEIVSCAEAQCAGALASCRAGGDFGGGGCGELTGCTNDCPDQDGDGEADAGCRRSCYSAATEQANVDNVELGYCFFLECGEADDPQQCFAEAIEGGACTEEWQTCQGQGPPPGPECGDGVCEDGETAESCPADCGEPPPPAECGNGECEAGETAESCPEDCAGDGDGLTACLADGCSEELAVCEDDQACSEGLECLEACGDPVGPACLVQCFEEPPASESAAGQLLACGQQIGCIQFDEPECGDGECAPGETAESCPEDCGEPDPEPECGDGSCDDGESPESCPEDCGEPLSCIEASCPDAVEACMGAPECAEVLTCILDCGGAGGSCAQQCLDEGGFSPELLQLVQCAQSSGCLDGGGGGTCGDGSCDPDESAASCPEDCGGPPPPGECGNGECEPGEEMTCPEDCDEPGSECGNGECEADETAASCPEDCGGPPPPGECGNGSCEPGEDADSCPEDCGGPPPPSCGDGTCADGESCGDCPEDCGSCEGTCCGGNGTPGCEDAACAEAVCEIDSYCCSNQWDDLCAECAFGGESATGESCASVVESGSCSCEASCGDGICAPVEDVESCPEDCGGAPGECGNGTCEPGEDAASCPEDCAEPPPAECGNGTCEGSETADSCPEDCEDSSEELIPCLEAECSEEFAACEQDPTCADALPCLKECVADGEEGCTFSCMPTFGFSSELFELGLCGGQSGCGNGGS